LTLEVKHPRVLVMTLSYPAGRPRQTEKDQPHAKRELPTETRAQFRYWRTALRCLCL